MPKVSELRAGLRSRIENGPIVVAPGSGDALGARLVQSQGFEAAYMSGFAVEGTYGKPDVGLLGLKEMADRAAQMVDTIEIPLICDADNGYGGAINVIRTVREFERAGVSAIHIEDQIFPKKCGSMEGRTCVETPEMVGKIKAALDTRTDPNFMIIARTDIFVSEGRQAAADRLATYAEAGADMLLVTGPYTTEDAESLIKGASRPLVYLNAETLTMPMMPVSRLEELGVGLVLFPLSLLLSSTQAMLRTLSVIKNQGTTLNTMSESSVPWKEFTSLVGFEDIKRYEEEYSK